MRTKRRSGKEDIPRDRPGRFELQIVKKYQTSLSVQDDQMLTVVQMFHQLRSPR